LNARQERCLAFLSEYDFEIKHIKGKENKIVDALNRKLNAVYSSNMQTDLKQKIKSTTENDEIYKNLQEKLQNNDSSEEESKFRCNQDGLVLYKDIIYIPNNADLKILILVEVHKKPYFRSPRIPKDYNNFEKRIFLAQNEN
jgi:hypothetical protein